MPLDDTTPDDNPSEDAALVDSAPDDTALDEIAAELCALPPSEFTAARNERAGTVDRALAARVRALRKPTVPAWCVNVLVHAGKLREAVELSAALREAQDDQDAAELTVLARQRRALVAALSDAAVGLAVGQGVAVSAAARQEVEKTINAAVVDSAAAAAVLTARLVRSLQAGAFDQDDLIDAVSGSLPGAAPKAPSASRDDLAERRARKEAERAAREARRAADDAERELARIDVKRKKSQERADRLHDQIEELGRDLSRLELEAHTADEHLARLEQDRKAAASVAESTAQAASKAQAASNAQAASKAQASSTTEGR